MKKLLLVGALTSAVFGSAMAGEQNAMLKIGVVNPLIIYQSVPQGEASIEALQQKLKPKTDVLQKQQADLMKQLQTLQTNAPTLTPSQLNAEKEKLAKAQQAFKAKADTFRQSEMLDEQGIAKQFQQSFSDAVTKVAHEGGYQMILSAQAVAYISPDLKADVTAKVTSLMQNQSDSKTAHKNQK